MTDAPSGEIRIVADRLVKRFGDFVAVNEVSFEARRGEIMGFLGPNGAGNPRRFESSAACCGRAAAGRKSPVSTSRAIPSGCGRTSATCRPVLMTRC
jgi:ABC-type hemin transport system ATPase subunit